MGGDLAPVGEADHPRRAPHLQAGDVGRGQDLGPELGRLAAGPVGELGAADPVGEAEVVLDPGALAGLPAGGLPLDQDGAQPLGGGVHGRAQPGRAAADDHRVVEAGGRGGRQADPGRQLLDARVDQGLALGGDHQRDAGLVQPGRLQQPPALGLVGGQPAVGHRVAGQEVAHLVGARRPAVAHHLGRGHRLVLGGAPQLDQLVQHRVELLVGRLPRLQQVVVEVDHVDRLDGRVGVGVGGQQGPPGVREQVHGLLQELQAAHLGHAVVGQQHRHQVAAELDLPQRLQRLRPRLGPHDPEVLPVAPPQVARDRPRHPGVVVDREQDRLARLHSARW